MYQFITRMYGKYSNGNAVTKIKSYMVLRAYELHTELLIR
jgi:hypothetical protein